ncbi:MAG: SPOR domain-containing protein [Psychromonas sp.]|nr:SPOR domain-containing protein [Psychromonas sp.]
MAPINKRKTAEAGKRKAPTTRKRQVSKRNQPKKGFPFLALSAALLLMGFIGYFIFAVDKPATPVVIKKQTVKKEEQLPEKPQPKWEYEQTLKTKEVEVDIPAEKKSSRPYQMQCGSFRHQGDAESLKARIAFQGLNSQVKKTGNWYRVILGPYERKRVAEKNRHKLQRAKINGCQIWYWR